MLRKTLAAALFLLSATSAQAASRVWISEYAVLTATASGGSSGPDGGPAGLVLSRRSTSAAAAQTSATFNGNTKYIRITARSNAPFVAMALLQRLRRSSCRRSAPSTLAFNRRHSLRDRGALIMAMGKLGRRGGFASGGALGSASTLDYFAGNGANYLWDQPNITRPHFYVSSTNTTWFFWDAWEVVNGANRHVIEVATYNHTTGRWSGNYAAGMDRHSLLDTDLHGVAVAARSPTDGYAYTFYSSHIATGVSISATVNADDPSKWNLQPRYITDVVLQHVVFVGSTMYLLGSTQTSSTQDTISVDKATPVAGVVGSWVGRKDLFYFGDGTNGHGWAPMATTLVVGTKIHFVFTATDPATGTGDGGKTADIFYAIYDTVTGDVANYSGGTSIASASQPINLTTARASFRIFTSALRSAHPALIIDGAGASHVVFGDSPNIDGTGGSIKHITANGGAWSAATTVVTLAGALSIFAQGPYLAPVVNGSGGVDFYYPDLSNPGLLTGSIYKMVRSSGGVWSGPTLIDTAPARGYVSPIPIVDGHTNARVAWAQASNDESTIDGTLRAKAYGDGGFLKRAPGFRLLTPGTTGTTMNPSDKSANIALSQSNYKATATATNGNGQLIRSTVGRSSGVYYVEATCDPNGTTDGVAFGLSGSAAALDGYDLGNAGNLSIGLFVSSAVVARVRLNGVSTPLSILKDSRTVGMLVNLDAHTVQYYLNGQTFGSQFNIAALPSTLYIAADIEQNGASVILNCGNSPYYCAPPAGVTGLW
jgi:hypothetical protein